MSVNRTSEFLRYTGVSSGNGTLSTRLHQPLRPSSSKTASSSSSTQSDPLAAYSKFALASIQLATDVKHTSSQLDELSVLAKVTDIFADPTDRINDLTLLIKRRLQALQKELEVLHLYAAKAPNKATQEHNTCVVNTLDKKLQTILGRFQAVLKLRSDNIQTQHDRRQLYTGSDPSTSSAKTMTSAVYSMTDDDSFWEDTDSEQQQVSRTPSSGHQVDDVALSIDLTQAQEHDPILGRAEEVERITGVLHEVGQMWTTISSLVAEQDHTIQRVDFDLQNTDANLQRAHSEVEILWNTVHSNRYLFMKVFAVLILFIIMFVVFFV